MTRPIVRRPALVVPAELIADPARASMLIALTGTDRLAATELAAAASVSQQSASGHLARLLEAGLVTWERSGRMRYYRLAGEDVKRALDALSAIAQPRPRVGALDSRDVAEASDRLVRTCYDHLAGHIGVEVLDALLRERVLSRRPSNYRPVKNQSYGLTKNGVQYLRAFGVDPRYVRTLGRSFAHACLDRTERRPHLAGSLGAAVLSRLLDLRWVERLNGTRALRVTPPGRAGLRRRFGVEV